MERILELGVRQGGILSPFLFNFYVNSVIDDICALQVGCTLGLLRVNIIMYADDVVLLAGNLDDANYLYTRFKILIQELQLKINENKSKCLIFRHKKNLPVNILDKILLKPVNEYIYLGHHLKYNLDDSDDIKSKLNKFYASFHSLYRKFNNLNIDAILYLFNSHCSPVYGLQL